MSRKKYPSYEDARSLVKQYGITEIPVYRMLCVELGLPHHPAKVYKNEWPGFRGFLSAKGVRYENLPGIVEKVRNHVANHGIATLKSILKKIDLGDTSETIARAEVITYMANYPTPLKMNGVFITLCSSNRKTYLTFNEVAAYCRKNKVMTVDQYRELCRNDQRFSSSFIKEFGWGNVHGNKKIRTKSQFLSKEQCLDLLKSKKEELEAMGIRVCQTLAGITPMELRDRVFGPDMLTDAFPKHFNKTYSLTAEERGTVGIRKLDLSSHISNYVGYETARDLLKTEGVNTISSYRENYKRLGLPSNPDQFYKEFSSFNSFFSK